MALASSNVPVQAFSSENIQIFGREKEIPLYIEDGGDGTIDNGDYILFYAEKNDGWLDSTLYDDPSWIGNPKYSLYNDTIQYFLTWNNSTSNKYNINRCLNLILSFRTWGRGDILHYTGKQIKQFKTQMFDLIILFICF